MKKLATENDYSGALSNLGFGLQAGTLGFGFEVNKQLSEKICVRFSYNRFTYSYDTDIEDIKSVAAADIKVGAVSIIGNYNLFKRFYVAGGLAVNLLKINAEAENIDGLELNDIKIKPEDFGGIKVKVTPDKFNPYLGIGFGRSQALKNRLAFSFELGALYQVKTKFELDSSGMLSDISSDQQEDILEESVKIPWYPVIRFNLSFKLTK
jgi:hypothetical protein